MRTFRESLGGAAIIVAALLSHSIRAVAADASAWDDDIRSSMRLITAPSRNGDLRAGIELKLKPGWHTYWRYPGDAGVPPRFNFQGSKNVKAVEVLWPAPQPISEGGLTAIGYTSSLIFPLQIRPQERGKPITLRLKLDYAV